MATSASPRRASCAPPSRTRPGSSEPERPARPSAGRHATPVAVPGRTVTGLVDRLLAVPGRTVTGRVDRLLAVPGPVACAVLGAVVFPEAAAGLHRGMR